MGQILRDLGRNDRGATLVEYAIIVALIALTAVSALRAVGDSVYSNFGRSADVQATAVGAGSGG